MEYPPMPASLQQHPHHVMSVGPMNGLVIKTEPGFLQLEPDFAPQSRARSNTWPLPRPEEPTQGPPSQQPPGDGEGEQALLGFPKKPTSRRNAWGNMSYADLITQAIHSAPDRRLTLSQIYDWMVTNVPYFKDKGDSNSSAGWKNSIRHNLSLHNRFMRVQNEGTGKSSWWILNPDAKPGKAARRRATSMETSKFEKKRGRIKKKLDAIRNGGLVTPSPPNSLSDGIDSFPQSPHVHSMYNLSPSDFRARANSNASSCGRLSPILGESIDFGSQEVGNGWDFPYPNYASPQIDRFGTDQLALGLANTMKLQDNNGYEFTQQGYHNAQPQQNFSAGIVGAQSGGFRRSPATIPTTIRNDGNGELLNRMYAAPYDGPSYLSDPCTPHQGHSDHRLQGMNGVEAELEFNLDLDPNSFECNVEEVLQGELSLGEGIDFNFGPTNPSQGGGSNHQAQPLTC